jgi:hypothetical protein
MELALRLEPILDLVAWLVATLDENLVCASANLILVVVAVAGRGLVRRWCVGLVGQGFSQCGSLLLLRHICSVHSAFGAVTRLVERRDRFADTVPLTTVCFAAESGVLRVEMCASREKDFRATVAARAM